MRRLGPFSANPIGLGCMNLSHGYGTPPTPSAGRMLLARALDMGVNHFDTAALYGFGRNEELVGAVLRPHRQGITLASKCGMRGVDGRRTIDAHTETLRHDLETSLRRLGTDVIDLYYLHRYDKVTPIEDSIGAMSRFVEEGKVRAIGLSEVSAPAIRRAHAVHPLSAVQSEYSLWSRNVEIAVLAACSELDISFVAFSPLGRGFLTDTDLIPGELPEKDVRLGMPRFQEPWFQRNSALLAEFRATANAAGITAAQLALRWVLSKGESIHVIPGTTSETHLEENLAALDVHIDPGVLHRAGVLINQSTVSGERYSPTTQREIDTEQF